MADKETRFLTQVDQLESDDLLSVYDLNNGDTRKEKVEKFLIPQIFPYAPPSGGGYAGINVLGIWSATMDIIDAGVEGVIARVTAFDIMKIVKGGDGSQITYGMSKDGIDWVDNIDPMLAYVDYICGEAPGPVIVYIRVQDSSYISVTASIFVLINDPSNLCGGP